jgi:mannosyltransferase
MTTVTDSSRGAPLWTSRADPIEQPTPWLWLAIMTALAVVLRAIGLNGGLWWDEINTLVASVRVPLRQIVTVFPDNNQHTLYSVLAHLSIQTFGDHIWALRLPAMVLGSATVPALYFFAREFVGRTEALLATLLLAVAYHHVWFSQNARGYTALAFLTIASSWLLLRGLRREKASDFVLYAIVAALGVYAHLTMVFLVVSHAILCAIPLGLPGPGAERWRRWRLPAMGFALAAVFTLLLYSPMLLDVQRFFVKKPSPAEVATPKWAVGAMLRGLQIGVGSLVGVLVAAAMLLTGLVSYFKQSRFLAGLFVLPGVITVAAAIALHRPIFPRFLFFLVGFAILIIVRGGLEVGRILGRQLSTVAVTSRIATRLGVPPLGFAMVLLMAALSVAALPLNYRYPKQDYEGAMHFVEAQDAPGEPIVTVGAADYPYREYFHRPWQAIGSLAQLDSLRASGRRIWVLYTLKRYVERETPDIMNALRTECVVKGVFRGTVGDGEVTVCEMEPIPRASRG